MGAKYLSAFLVSTAFLHCCIQLVIFQIPIYSSMLCYIHFQADFCWSVISPASNFFDLFVERVLEVSYIDEKRSYGMYCAFANLRSIGN